MRSQLVRLGLILSLALSTAAPAQQATRFLERATAIANGAETAARRQVIVESLEGAGVKYVLEEFTFRGVSGTNIVAHLSGQDGTKTLLLGAHYDRVAQGRGAVDNASSCAVLLELLARLKSAPLQSYAVKAVFFDQEERGLIGSQAYFARERDTARPSLALNLDIFGYGDTFFATTTSPADGPLMAALRQAAEEASMPVRLSQSIDQYPASDHRSMGAAGLDTVGLALIDGAEIDAILQRAGPRPRIMTIIHTPLDTIENVRGDDVEKALLVLERMIRLVDQR